MSCRKEINIDEFPTNRKILMAKGKISGRVGSKTTKKTNERIKCTGITVSLSLSNQDLSQKAVEF